MRTGHRGNLEIGAVARIVGVHAQTLRYYERMGIIKPVRSEGNQRLYTQSDVERLRRIRTLVDGLGVNLAGVEVILRLTDHIAEVTRQVEEMRAEIDRLSS